MWPFTETPNRPACHCDHRLLFLPPSKRNPPRSDFRTPPTPRSTNCGFRFCERTWLPFPMAVLQFYEPTLQMDNERSWIPSFSTTIIRLTLDIRIDKRFWGETLQMAWNGVVVKDQL
ncbi:hypothetical protein AVEN_166962-1 [Araneus ventricosus]|uniref:Uncharacterized protein n=1 Tax=Araneus ventricosus TaxID=182803 RepID=A0A4Y2K8U4_ARAVE|nr:hypothetical protein AVEN_166962-1 [Araneus ventricosus]